MNKEDLENERLAKSISLSNFLSGALGLEALSDAKKFREFLKKRSINTRGLLSGMILVFKNLIDDQMLQIQGDACFSLEEDRLTFRAFQKDIPINRVKSNMELAKILRGLSIVKEKVSNELTMPDFQAAILEELSPWFNSVDELFVNHTDILKDEIKKLRKQECRQLHAFSWYLRFLNIRQQLRIPLRDSPIGERMLERTENRKRRNEFDKHLKGWKVTAAYLWWSLNYDKLPEITLDDIMECESWEELDGLFRPIANGPIRRVDKILGTKLGSVFIRSSDCRPNSLEDIMTEFDVNEPLDIKEQLDHHFLWYDFQILDGAHPKIFPGTSTFVGLLLGTVELRRIYDRKQLVEVRRILHPTGLGDDKYDISYAILVPAFSTVADYSGWLVSLHCCNNYSGVSGGMRIQAETVIEAFTEHLNVEEFKIELKELRQYFRNRIDEQLEDPFGIQYLSQSERNLLDLEESIGIGRTMSAVILELFMAVIMAEEGYSVHWQYKNAKITGKREIDVLAFDDKEVHIIECSRHLPINEKGISKIAKEIKRKSTLIQNSRFERPIVRLRYITTKSVRREPFKNTAQELKKEGILVESVYDILSDSGHKVKPIQEVLWRIESLGIGLDYS